jgi:hypothetical protein
VLDDGSERSIILPQAFHQLNLTSEPETLTLRAVRQDIVGASVIVDASVIIDVSPLLKPFKKYGILQAFTTGNLGLSKHSCPVAAHQR